MLRLDSDIVEFPNVVGAFARIRLDKWPRTKGITEKCFKALKDGGFIRQRQFHQRSRAYPRWTLTDAGRALAQD